MSPQSLNLFQGKRIENKDFILLGFGFIASSSQHLSAIRKLNLYTSFEIQLPISPQL
jgi:hypothetical protein